MSLSCHISWQRMDSSDLDALWYMVPWDPHESVPKRHLDRFSRFNIAHPSAQQTDRLTDTQTDSSYLCPNRWLVIPRNSEWIRPMLTPSNTCFLMPMWVISPSAVSIVSPVFAWLNLLPKTAKSYALQCFSTCRRTPKSAPSRGKIWTPPTR